MKQLARNLRKRSTEAEKILWYYLRAHRMAGCKFRRQFIIEPYIVDFACLEAKLIIEADGGQHAHGSMQRRFSNTFSGKPWLPRFKILES